MKPAFLDEQTDHPAPDSVEFVVMVESGRLEAQAVLLCESIRAFAGRYAASRLTAVSSRASRRPSANTTRRLDELGVDLVFLDLVSCAPDYGTTYRVHASSVIERRTGPGVLAVLDSDSVFVHEPDLRLDGADVAVRPVDVKGMCTTGAGDPFDSYWRELTRVCAVDYDSLPTVTATVDGAVVRASYNGGFVVARRSAGIFQRTERFLERSIAVDLRPHRGSGLRVRAGYGDVGGEGSELWGSAQACLSLAIWGAGLSARTLPSSHNFPLHLVDLTREPLEERADLVHLHYHRVFEEPSTQNAAFNARLELPPEWLEWLRVRVPLPTDGGPRPSVP